MTEQARKTLQNDIERYCRDKPCVSCPLFHKENMSLCAKDFNDMDDYEISAMWSMLFPDVKPVPDEKTQAEPEHDEINHPEHYTNGGMECIDEMIATFGKEAVAHFCICNVWKYRYRAGSKGDPEKDRQKADWYMKKFVELKS